MDCNNLNGISNSNCDMSIGGIFKVFIFPFDDIDQYTYTDNDLNYVTGYSAVTLPSLYKPNQLSSEYTGNKSERNYELYDHQLVLNFLTLTREKRDEFRKLSMMDLTVMFVDRNGRCWIMGQDTPVRMSTNQLGTGVKDGVNGYEITLVSEERNQLREIVSPSEGCFTSFTAVEARRTVFEITATSFRSWEYLETDVNGILVDIDLSSTQALDPSQWNTDPLILAHDRSILTNLFTSVGGSITNLLTTYDSGSDTTTIIIDSSDTAYGTLQVDFQVFNKSDYSAVLTMQTILSAGIANPSTIIEVRDSNNNIVFSGGYGNTIVQPSISGQTNNAILIMSDLYPSGTTLTVELINVPCSTVSYTYNYVNTLEACALESTFSFNKDLRTKIHVPYLTDGGVSPITQRYQNMTINIQGVSFQLYKNYTTWHDDFNTFVNDITLKLYQVNLPIDLNSLVFTDTGTGVDIEFNLTSNTLNLYTKQLTVAYEDNYISDDWIQGRVVNLQTSAPLNSTITHTDNHSHQMTGENFISITSNNFDLGYNSFGNTSVDNVSLLWAYDDTVPYNSNDTITTTSLGGNCNTPTLTSTFDECYDDYISSLDGYYGILSLDVAPPTSINMGNTFELIYTDGFSPITYTFTTPSVISPNNNIHYLIDRLQSIRGINVIHYDFEPLDRRYILHFKFNNNVSIISLEDVNNSRSFDVSAIQPVYKNTLTTNINPFISLRWTLPTTELSTPTNIQDLRSGYWQMKDIFTSAVSVVWDQSGDELTFTKQAGIPNDITISLHEVYPTDSNQVLFDLIPNGTVTKTLTSVSSTLISNGSSVADVKYVAYTNNIGWRFVKPIDLLAANQEIQFTEFIQTPIMWGTMDSLSYIGSQTLSQPSVFSGVSSCYSCCGGSLIPTGFEPLGVNFMTEEVSTNEFRISIIFDDTISCDIDYMELTIDNTVLPIPTPLNITLTLKDCINGKAKFTADDDNLITFASDPSTTENDVMIEMFNSSNVSLGTFELELSYL